MGYAFKPHTADVRMDVWGASKEELFVDAARGMMELLLPQRDRGVERSAKCRKVKISSDVMTVLLVSFLNELLAFSHIYFEVYDDIRILSMTNTMIEAEICGLRAPQFREDIKAVTYHEAEICKGDDGIWRTVLIFDI